MKEYNQMNINKNYILNAIMSNQNILKCLYYTDNNSDILSLPDLNSEQKMQIVKNNIHKFRKIPTDRDDIQKIYISMEYGEVFYMGNNGGYYSAQNPYFKLPNFIFYIISYDTLDDNNVIGSRTDKIEEEIYGIFHNKNVIDDFGKSFLINSTPLTLPKNYVGRQVMMRFVGKNE